MTWASFPTAWLRPVPREAARPGTPDVVGFEADEEKRDRYPLADFAWRKDGSSSMAALMVLIALSIRLNQSTKGREISDDDALAHSVAVTYDDLQRMTGFARASVATGIALLESVGAIRRKKYGRANRYELPNLAVRGGWCQLPQDVLLKSDQTLAIKPFERKRSALHALKVYVALLALRNQRLNTATIGYEGIAKWTGLRKADVGRALHILIAWDLLHIVEHESGEHPLDDQRTRSYRLAGLSSVNAQR